MEKYIEDELADGEDDEKRIQRADFRAGKKLKSVKGAKNKKGSGPRSGKKPRHAIIYIVSRLEEGLPLMGRDHNSCIIAYSR